MSPPWAQDFDVFLSYAHADLDLARSLKKRLEAMGLRSRMDEEFRPGLSWSTVMEDWLSTAPAIAVLIGPSDLGNTQEAEVDFALNRQRQEKADGKQLPVIPVILPNSKQSAKKQFLSLNHWVNFGNGFSDMELERLYFGVTGRQYRLPESTRVVGPMLPDSPVDKAVKSLNPRLGEGGVSFLIGSGVARPPSVADLVGQIVADLRRSYPTIPEIPMLDLAGSCLAVGRADDMAAEDTLRGVLGDKGTEAFPVHAALASLAAAVAARAPARRTTSSPRARAEKRQQPLVFVTSNFDLLLERALMRERIRFLRCVQQHSTSSIAVDEFEPAEYEQLLPGTSDDLDDFVEASDHRPAEALPGGGARLPDVLAASGKPPDVILYKVLGSRDITGSCFISADHHYHFLQESLKEGRLPDLITSTVRNNRLVFLGYTLFDPVLRLLRHTLLAGRRNGVPCYAVKTRPPDNELTLDHRLEATLWSDATKAWVEKLLITFIESDEVAFLEQLKTKFLATT